MTWHRRLGFTTGFYQQLQGLRSLPGAVGLTVLGAITFVTDLSMPVVLALGVGLAAIAAGGYVRIARWYHRTYGRAQPLRRRRWPSTMITWGVILPFYAFNLHVPWIRNLTVGLGAVVCVGAAWLSVRLLGVVQPSYVLLSAAGVITALVLIATGPPELTEQRSLGLWALILGGALIGGCIADHFFLTRTLEQAQRNARDVAV